MCSRPCARHRIAVRYPVPSLAPTSAVAALLVRLFDRMFEFVFLAERTAEQQEQIVLTFVDIVATYIERFATPAGLEGISAEEFVRTLAGDPSTVRAADGARNQTGASTSDRIPGAAPTK